MKAFKIIVSIAILGSFLFGCQIEEQPIEKPNILYIMTDDHSFQTISAYSDKLIKTPNIDRIAEEGVIFANSFVGNSICAPSRATMLTGKHTHKNGQVDNRVTFDGSQTTFPKLLQKAGYQTALVGKWHLRSDPTGFDYWNILPGQGQYYNPDFIEMGEEKQFEGYCTTLTTDFALDWLDSRDKEKPFCLLLHHKAPHRTWQPDTAHFSDFADKVYPVPDNFFDDYEGRTAAAEQRLSIRANDMDIRYDLKMQDEQIESRFPWMDHTARMNEQQKKAWNAHYKPITADFLEKDLEGRELYLWKYQRYMRDYLACIRSVDENVGRVLDFLKQNGLDENTLVVYTSDQGFYMGEHGWFDKRFMYEESLHTPLIMRLPKGYPAKGINYVTSVNAQMSEEHEKKAIAGYYASVSYMDAQVGKVLKTLEDEGLEDNTIVIFTSDHGFHLGEHRFWMKVSLHEESVRVPLIIKVPGKKPGVCHSLVELIDLYPTVAELAGLETSPHLQGKSLVETLDDSTVEVRDMAFSMNNWRGKTYLLRTKKWAFIQYDKDAGSGIELFDMDYDPGQYNNLANNPRYADVVAEFKERLQQKLKEVRTNDLEIDYTN